MKAPTPSPRAAEPLTIVVAADENYAKPMAALLTSILTNLSKPKRARIYLLDSGVTAASLARLRALVSRLSGGLSTFEVLAPPRSRTDRFEQVAWFTRSAYLRLLIPEMLPAGTRRAIYLDCDMIVFDDLRKLWRCRFARPVAAVQDCGIPNISDPLRMSPNVPIVPFPLFDVYRPDPRTPYCNSGMLVIDVERWKRAKVTEKALDYVDKARGQLRLPDQDALNIALLGDWHPISVRWNLPLIVVRGAHSLPDSPVKEALIKSGSRFLRKPGIYHWLGPAKPWNSGFVTAPFLHFLALSGWDDAEATQSHEAA